MKKHYLPISFLLFTICLSINSIAQADTLNIPKPIVKGDSILCPNSTGTLRTQKGYDSYQWYKRNFGSNKAKAIDGATTNELSVSSDVTPAYFSVAVTVKNIELQSDDKLVDGLVFLPPSVKISGDFKNGPGYSILREGDTGIFTLTKPYNTNITWYKNSEPIRGETSNKLFVTTGGIYTVKGAPRTCPNYIVPLGVDLYVQLKKPRNDSSGNVNSASNATAIVTGENSGIKAYPNPARDNISIEGLNASKKTSISIIDLRGNIVLKTTTINSALTLNLQKLSPGVYYIKLESAVTAKTIKILKE